MIKKVVDKLILIKMVIVLFAIPLISCSAQLDLTRFWDSAHHWYDIHDQNRIIEPLPDQPKYRIHEYRNIADNILLFQKDNGGWSKNFDMQAILNKDQKEKVQEDKRVLNTTFDNGGTHSQMGYLAEVYTITKDEKYKKSFMHGLQFILESQYLNGGWPQCYPDTSGYQKYITFNDGAMMGIMNLLGKIVERDPNYDFIVEPEFGKVKDSYEKGIECILNTQIVENGLTTVWCQQHDNISLKAQNARTFEPAAICNGESAEIVMFLMQIKNPNERIISSIKNAVSWFNESAIFGIRVDVIEAPKVDYMYHTSTWDRVVVEDTDAPKIWTRFYELGTHVPLFCRRDGVKVYSMAEVERERRSGYSWYNYAPQAVLSEYPNWLKK